MYVCVFVCVREGAGRSRHCTGKITSRFVLSFFVRDENGRYFLMKLEY